MAPAVSLDRVAAKVAAVLCLPEGALHPSPGRPGPRLPLARCIDHTLLRPEAGADDVRRFCAEARAYGFRAVCVNPYWVRLAAAEMAGTETSIATVCGFPLGAATSAVKVYEAERAVADGAAEVDMVMAIGLLRAGDYAAVLDDMRAVRRAVTGKILKIILETCLLDEEDRVAAAILARHAGADYVKTSTGFAKSGASVADVTLLRAAVGWEIGVKAAGGIRDRATAEAMLSAGATRLGTSAGVAIVGEVRDGEEGY